MKNTISLILYLAILFACDNENVQPFNRQTDYFPLESGKQWQYQRWLDNLPAGENSAIFDTLKLSVQGDTIVDDQAYKIINDQFGNIDKIVRRSDGQYFGRHHELYGTFSHEYVFLDLTKAPGESWSYVKDEGATKTEYVILSKGGTKTVSGIEYSNVIEVQVNYYNLSSNGGFELWVSAFHYYAEGVGEIYHYYPYPVSLVYGNITGLILN
jgi:hypothetical protein